MKTKKMKIKQYLVVFLSLFFAGNSLAQSTYIKNRKDIKLSSNYYVKAGPTFNWEIKTELNYGIHEYIEIGSYLGASSTWGIDLSKYYTEQMYFYNIYYTGLNTNFHLLSFLIKNKDFRFDLYLTNRFSVIYSDAPKTQETSGFFVQHRAGLGFSMKVYKKLGVFFEYEYSTNPPQTFEKGYSGYDRWGLSYKF